MRCCRHCERVALAKAIENPTARQLAEATGMTSTGARFFAKQHGIVFVLPPKRERPARPPRAPRPPSGARVGLIHLLKERPNICAEMSLADIGKELGVTRERVRQLMPDYAKRRLAAVGVLNRVAVFIEEHPEVTIPKWMGGMTYDEATALTGIPSFGAAMHALGYDKRLIQQTKAERKQQIADAQRRRLADPAKRVEHLIRTRAWKAAHPETVREMNKRARLRWGAKVLRQQRCIACGVEFPWTNSKNKAWLHRGTRIVCSAACGRRAALREAKRVLQEAHD